MSQPIKRSLMVWGLGHLIPLVHAYKCHYSQLENLEDKYLVLADGFFVPAVLLLGLGVLSWLASTGQFQGIKYAAYVMLERFRPRKAEKPLSYPEFLEKQAVRPRGSLLPMFGPGAYFFVVSFIFNVLFGF